MPCRISRNARVVASAMALLASVLAVDATTAHASCAAPGKPLRVAVDIGHNKSAPGATSATGKRELYFNRVFATELVAEAKAERALEVFLINPRGRELGLAQRPQLAAAQKANVFISVHHDSVQPRYLKPWTYKGVTRQYTEEIAGFGMFVSDGGSRRAEELKLAQLIGDRLLAIGLKPSLHHAEKIPGESRVVLDARRGIYEAPFAVLVNARMPAILLEVGVLPNKEEEQRLEDRQWRQRFQAAVVEALKAYCP